MTLKSATLPPDYVPLMEELYRRAAAHNQPVSGTFELTERCNLACRMCYVCQKPRDSYRRHNELSASAWVDLAGQAVEGGMVFLLLTGGEVFLRRDFFDIYTPLTRMGIEITLFTNGTLITDALAARLAEAPPGRTEVTIYGATAATYEAVTGVPGSYARCCAGIEALIKYRVPLGIKSTLTRQNAGELDAMQLMADNWGLPFSASWLLCKRRDGTESQISDCRLAASACVSLEATDRASATEWAEVAMQDPVLGVDRNFHCQAGLTSFVISPLGEMNACVDLPAPRARTMQIGFRKSWEQLRCFVDSVPPPSSTCLGCDVKRYCARCPAWSLLETGTMTDPVPYLCEIAHERKRRYTHSSA